MKVNDNSIIGRCVDCERKYDTLSGLVVCTVCRLPVIVCNVCTVEKCYPGEYHCYRHRLVLEFRLMVVFGLSSGMLCFLAYALFSILTRTLTLTLTDI
jgi:hypothetical protein